MHLQNISIYVCMHTFTTCMNIHAIDICMYLCVCSPIASLGLKDNPPFWVSRFSFFSI